MRINHAFYLLGWLTCAAMARLEMVGSEIAGLEMVELESVECDAEAEELKGYLQMHVERTGSSVAQGLLEQWPAPLGQFVKVMPTDYKRVLEEMAAEAELKEVAA